LTAAKARAGELPIVPPPVESPSSNPPASLPLLLETIDTDDGWARHRDRAQALCGAAAPAFAAPQWLDAAWSWRAAGAERRFVFARDDGRDIGFVPLERIGESVAGLPARTLQFVTVPDTQFVDLVCAPADAPAFARALADSLQATRHQWDCLRLNYLADIHGNWRRLVQALPRAGIACAVEAAGSNPYVDLGGDFADYYGARSRSLKKAVNLAANRLAKAGSISVDWVRDGAPVESALAEAIRISALSWKQETGNSLDQPGPRAFIERLTGAAARDGRLSLWLLRLDGAVIATEYQLLDGGNVHALRSDFDPRHAEASPGTYLNHHLLKALFGQGLRRYYMGPGSNAYKLRWTDLAEPMFRLTAYSPTARGRLLRWLEQSARPLARRLRDRLRPRAAQAAEATQ